MCNVRDAFIELFEKNDSISASFWRVSFCRCKWLPILGQKWRKTTWETFVTPSIG